MLGSIFFFTLIYSTILVIILFFSHKIVSRLFVSIPFYPYFGLAILISYFTVFSFIPKTYFQINERALAFVMISLAEFFISIGFIIFFVIYKRMGPQGYMFGQLMKGCVFFPYFIILIIKRANLKINYTILKNYLSFSLPMIPALLSVWGLNMADKLFIERYVGLSQVGLYSLANTFSQIVLIFSAAFYSAYNPLFYRIANSKDQKNAKEILFKYNKIYVQILILVSFLITFFAKEIIIILIDPRYFDAYKYLQILILGILFSQMSGLLNLSIYQSKKTKQLTIIVTSTGMLNIILNFLLVPTFGAYGAAIATCFSYFIFFVIKYLYTNKCYFIPFAWKSHIFTICIFASITILFIYLDLSLIINLSLKILTMLILLYFYINQNKKYLILLSRRQ
jgi:O-antigen/teichoic acid export membrane protein